MKTCVTPDGGGIDSLIIEERPVTGQLAEGQIRIAMRAASINYRDLLAVSGQLGPVGSSGLIPCSDGAGEVIETAPDVQRVKVGDAVALTFLPDWMGGPWRANTVPLSRGYPLPGVMREEVVVHNSEAVVLPRHLSFEEGATLPCAAVTAWHSLCSAVPLMPGMSVLLQGAGGVSVFALQFAKLYGARVIIISSSEERCERLRELGADEAINYREVPEWDKVVRELTGGQGVDLAVDIGGAETIDRSVAATRRGGRVALVGLITGLPSQLSNVFLSSVDVTPIKVGSRDDFEMMNRAIGFHRLRPVIDRTFNFDELPQALRCLEGGKHFGKIAIRF